MRLLIYLLAMMTGFSAAEAARPVSATPATHGAAVAQAAVIAASLPSENRTAAATDLDRTPSLSVILVVNGLGTEPSTLALTSPVIRHDITLQ